jgi:hypothetical protein
MESLVYEDSPLADYLEGRAPVVPTISKTLLTPSDVYR